MKVDIVNTHVVGQYDGVYCGRGSPFGNYASQPGMTRDQMCDAYAQAFPTVSQQEPLHSALHALRKQLEHTGYVRLRCFCHPKRCHTETIRRWLLDNAFEHDEEVFI